MAGGKNPIRFQCGNYMHRVDDAIFIHFDKISVYFANNKLIGVMQDGTLYRDEKETSGVNYRRIRAAVNNQAQNVRSKFVSKRELNDMLEAAIMLMASRLVDEKLGIDDPNHRPASAYPLPWP